ncbi:glycoside hydrolase family 2 TIM barrel-domain containing protein [Chitinophaga sp. 22321]|uniref:beta-galactosidase n=1 Tax=Chitinophaga hostae TaxID=2831022 RepID=A0ABS5J3M4_9BACT|nr:glycoside hydrolase family 2 TIM barrel-domain containing protein [Chitinophaga hostae]MBS0029147.1 glycoside hydrolase family 2 [Chitinophaga hostae]
MSARLLLLLGGLLCLQTVLAQETRRIYLSGTDKDHTVDWDFYCSGGQRSGKHTTIAVPSNWEQQGFGGYNYGHDKVKADEQGFYRYRFPAPANWQQRQVNIVFDGVMTDATIKINGKLAGPVHQGGFYRFKYDISSLLRSGSNLLEVKVSKQSADAGVNRAERNGDFWVLGGIYRPVFLEVKPLVHIDHVAINATANGDFSVQTFTSALPAGCTLSAQVFTMNGQPVQEAVQVPGANGQVYTLRQSVSHPATWSAEFPNRYQAVIQLKKGAQVLHSVTQPFGFRTIEIRPRDGIYVNDTRVMLKGVNRHSAWPETGRTLSKAISILDVNLMKDMNINAVRMSHYPPDEHFLDVCDSLGLFVLDELTGWQGAYDTVVGHRLVRELVERDVNHPSVIFWDNGNEGGFNRALDGDFAEYDPQLRPVLHPWERYNGLDTRHYPDFSYVVNSSLYDQDILMPTEFMHGLYDGGHGAGLPDFWERMLQHPRCAGGFLWAFADEGLVRRDKHDSIDTDGNHAPDGIVGPHREKEGSFYAIKTTWSPVHISLPVISSGFNGRVPVENRYDYTSLAQCRFRWQLLRLPSPGKNNKADTIAAGTIPAPDLAPHAKGFLQLALPGNWQQADVLYITAQDPYGREIVTHSWPLQSPRKAANSFPGGAQQNVVTTNSGDTVIVHHADAAYYFSRSSGQLLQMMTSKGKISLSGGPVLAGIKQELQQFEVTPTNGGCTINARYEGKGFLQVKWTFQPGVSAAHLEYSYSIKGETPFTGITFRYPEEKVKGLGWIGEGPYRVWKNRLQGQQFGSWYKAYNNTITGESWEYPEFKGYHANVYRATFHTTEQDLTFYTGNEGTFLQIFHPQPPRGASNNNTNPAFPDGDIGFMNTIAPIGTKFQQAALMGPESQANGQLNYTPVRGEIWISF